MTTVLLAEDHDMFRNMIRLALSREPALEIVGEATNALRTLAEARRLRPDVVLLDYNMPGVENFEGQVRDIRSIRVGMEVVVLTGHRSDEVAFAAARGGALGYVLKSTPLVAVVQAVLAASRRRVWIDRELGTAAVDTFNSARSGGDESSRRCDVLSAREREVLACAARGRTNREIAGDLDISEETVKTHMSTIFSKLQVHNRLAAVMAFTDPTHL